MEAATPCSYLNNTQPTLSLLTGLLNPMAFCINMYQIPVGSNALKQTDDHGPYSLIKGRQPPLVSAVIPMCAHQNSGRLVRSIPQLPLFLFWEERESSRNFAGDMLDL